MEAQHPIDQPRINQTPDQTPKWADIDPILQLLRLPPSQRRDLPQIQGVPKAFDRLTSRAP